MTVFRVLGCAVMLLLGPSCLAQGVTVRVINGKTGKPLPNEKVTISFLYTTGKRIPPKHAANLTAKTDTNGETHFKLPTPAPEDLGGQIRLTSPYWRCACLVLATTKEVMQKGIVLGLKPGGRSRKSAAAVNAVPGEILVVARPLSLLERLLYPLMKE